MTSREKSPGKLIRVHKVVLDALEKRYDERPIERTMQADILNYYELLDGAVRRLKFDEDEIALLEWMFVRKQVKPHEYPALCHAVTRLRHQYPFGWARAEAVAARLGKLSPLESLAVCDAMERAVFHDTYHYGKAAMYRIVGILPPSTDDPFPRPVAVHEPDPVILQTSSSWCWPERWVDVVAAFKALDAPVEEIERMDDRMVTASFVERDTILAEDDLIRRFYQRFSPDGVGLGLWHRVIEAVGMVRKHSDYDLDRRAAYRAAGLCR